VDQAARTHNDVHPAPSHGPAGTGAGGDAQNVFDTFGDPPAGPYEVGHLTVSDDGQVTVAYPATQAVAFDFVYRGVPFHAELPGDLAAPLSISAILGVLPYSAETAVGRQATLEILRLARPARGRVSLASEGRIYAQFSAPVPRPRTPVAVVATVSCLLIDLRPYMDLLTAAGAVRAGARRIGHG
jgi:hypothetical protein